MKWGRFCLVFSLFLSAFSFAEESPSAHAGDQQGYEVVRGWPQLPEGLSLGQVPGVDVDSHGNVFIFQRGSYLNALTPRARPLEAVKEPAVLVMDGESGKVIRRWGEGRFIYPHGVTIDAKDNVWLTDVGLHQVFKFSRDGKLLMSLGEAGKAGDDEKHFNGPTDVAVLPNGTFFVSDGYGNNRVMKFSAAGEVLAVWGKKGDKPGEFNLPHSIDVDELGNVYVSDRGNKRIQVFDLEGKLLGVWKDACGVPYVVKVKGGKRFVADGGDLPGPVNRSSICVFDKKGNMQNRFGRLGRYEGEFDVAHDVAVDAKTGAVYVVDILGQRVQKFLPKNL